MKVGNWVDAGAGKADADIVALADKLNTVKGRTWLAVHHEPAGDGAPADWANMQRRLLPLIARRYVKPAVIVNGFWWSNMNQGLSDKQISAWLPADVLDLCDLVAADTYHGGIPTRPGEPPAPKITNFKAWADRTCPEVDLGVGEFSAHTAKAIVDAVAALRAGRFRVACIFNSERNSRDGVEWPLAGDRLAAFKAALAGN